MAIETNSQVVIPIARRIQECWLSAPRHPSPMVIDWMYRCTVACKNFHKENASLLYEGCIEDVKEAMKLLSHQWAVGGIEVFSFLVHKLLTGVCRSVLKAS